jgi:peptidylprolyl isomerase
MRKTASFVMSLWLCSVALGCGASSDGDSASESEGSRNTSSSEDSAYDAPDSSESDGRDADPAEPADTESEADSAGAEDETEPDLSAPDDVAAPPDDAEVTASGLASKVLVTGNGTQRPLATDTVRVHYSGWQTDGTLFDSSLSRGRPSEFALNRVIEGWTEGLQLMVEGEQRRFWIPEDLAYRGTPDRPSGMLVFDVELIAIVTP